MIKDKITNDKITNDKIMIAPPSKGFTVYRGDAARLEDGKIKGTLYNIGESLRPSIVRSWTTSHKIAKRFACEYIKSREERVVPIIYHGVANRVEKGLFWDSEREVYIKRDKSRLKEIEIVDIKECEELKS